MVSVGLYVQEGHIAMGALNVFLSCSSDWLTLSDLGAVENIYD